MGIIGNIQKCPNCGGIIDLDTAEVCEACMNYICKRCGTCHVHCGRDIRRKVFEWSKKDDWPGNIETEYRI